MSVTAFDNEASSKSLEEAGFTDVQIVALMDCMRRSAQVGDQPQSVPKVIAKTLRDANSARGGSIGHAIAMMVLAVGGVGALLAILVRIA